MLEGPLNAEESDSTSATGVRVRRSPTEWFRRRLWVAMSTSARVYVPIYLLLWSPVFVFGAKFYVLYGRVTSNGALRDWLSARDPKEYERVVNLLLFLCGRVCLTATLVMCFHTLRDVTHPTKGAIAKLVGSPRGGPRSTSGRGYVYFRPGRVSEWREFNHRTCRTRVFDKLIRSDGSLSNVCQFTAMSCVLVWATIVVL